MHRSTIIAEGMADMTGLLKPELEEKIPRSAVSLESKGNDLIIRIEAEDVSALRATISSYLRWISVATATKDVMEE
jgi:tRNA threonylcarbamoyladenosine modification (KEOPS) complex  Pcc1 subunit